MRDCRGKVLGIKPPKEGAVKRFCTAFTECLATLVHVLNCGGGSYPHKRFYYRQKISTFRDTSVLAMRRAAASRWSGLRRLSRCLYVACIGTFYSGSFRRFGNRACGSNPLSIMLLVYNCKVLLKWQLAKYCEVARCHGYATAFAP